MFSLLIHVARLTAQVAVLEGKEKEVAVQRAMTEFDGLAQDMQLSIPDARRAQLERMIRDFVA
ncbi:hypothetical protein DEIPH_ctg011orf0008 [Deinococcus phoenicis]|uniref:Uncharacterized protein n=1 Tax=Deinococcus phoenicis TaxID=1476583 RepID=A0A016QTF7_9DEIO|nr:hypothetical protein [Deinococcus phoenicis]EYB69044.1 hypothetical protein DEIPH_ctg011orf0008 [Deinococcus phoenicis]